VPVKSQRKALRPINILLSRLQPDFGVILVIPRVGHGILIRVQFPKVGIQMWIGLTWFSVPVFSSSAGLGFLCDLASKDCGGCDGCERSDSACGVEAVCGWVMASVPPSVGVREYLSSDCLLTLLSPVASSISISLSNPSSFISFSISFSI
jgi:hypothetical protein